MTNEKSAASNKGSTKKPSYSKLNQEDNLDTFEEDILESPDFVGRGAELKKSGKRDHEIYDNTYYIPNDKLRLLEIPMNSNLLFQMLMYYHSFYDVLYAFLLIPSGLVKIFIFDIAGEPLSMVNVFMTIFYCLTELFRLNFGYNGNINESFPELIAFII